MTKNERIDAIITHALEIDADFDLFALYHSIRYFAPISPLALMTRIDRELLTLLKSLTPLEMREFCESYEICPIHACDINICIDDDDAECAHLR